MAYFRKRGNTWSYTVDIGIDPGTGKRRQQTKSGFKTKREAQLHAGDVEKKVAQNTYFKTSESTFKEYAKEWHEEYKLSVKMSTADIRLRIIEILNRHFGAQKIKDITQKKYQDALNQLGQHYSDNTMDIIHSTAKLIFKRAMKYREIHSDPSKFAKVIRKKKTVEELEQDIIPKYMEKEELALFLETAKAHFDFQDYAAFYTLAYTGLRIGELAALKWSDISFENQTLKVTKTCYLPNNNCLKFKLLPPKTEASRREITIDVSVVRELKIHKFNQNNLRERLNQKSKVYVDHDFVFTSYRNHGYPYNKATFESRMGQILKKANVQTHLSPHSLRHTHVSLLAETGKVSLAEIMDRLGHEDDRVTRRIYLHVTKTKKVQASNAFAELMETTKNVVKM